MAKVKEKLYEHRFGVFFFAVLVIYSFLSEEVLRSFEVGGWAYTFYAIDFSFGFATKILPGAVFNLIMGTPTQIKIAIYMKALYIFFCFLFSYIADKYYVKTGGKGMFPFFIMAAYIYYSMFTGNVYSLLDIHWLILAAVFFICLSNKKLYYFLPIFFVIAIMIHYAAILCYVPFFAIMVLYKAVTAENKREQRLLSAIFGVSVVISLGLFFYMLFFEADNATYATYEEFKNVLKARGAEEFRYFTPYFYREETGQSFNDLGANIENVFEERNWFFKFLNMLVTQTKATEFVERDFTYNYYYLYPVFPIMCLLFKVIINSQKSSKRKGTNFTVFCILALFCLTIIFGFAFSADKIRWLCHALISLTGYYMYTSYEEKHPAIVFEKEAEKIPKSMFGIYVLVIFVFYLM